MWYPTFVVDCDTGHRTVTVWNEAEAWNQLGETLHIVATTPDFGSRDLVVDTDGVPFENGGDFGPQDAIEIVFLAQSTAVSITWNWGASHHDQHSLSGTIGSC